MLLYLSVVWLLLVKGEEMKYDFGEPAPTHNLLFNMMFLNIFVYVQGAWCTFGPWDFV